MQAENIEDVNETETESDGVMESRSLRGKATEKLSVELKRINK